MNAYYSNGYRAGWLDASLGLRLQIAVQSPLPGYAAGYKQAQRDYAARGAR